MKKNDVIAIIIIILFIILAGVSFGIWKLVSMAKNHMSATGSSSRSSSEIADWFKNVLFLNHDPSTFRALMPPSRYPSGTESAWPLLSCLFFLGTAVWRWIFITFFLPKIMVECGWVMSGWLWLTTSHSHSGLRRNIMVISDYGLCWAAGYVYV